MIVRGPLKPTTFLVRNAGKSLPLAGVIVLAVLLVAGIVSMMNSIPLSITTVYNYARQHTGITSRGDPTALEGLIGTVKAESPVPVDRVMRARSTDSEVTSIVGPLAFVVLGLEQEDMRYYIDRQGGGRIEGRLPSAGEAGMIVSEPVARNLGKKLGDVMLGPAISESYSPREVKLVGILHNPEWLMLVPIEYLRANHFPPIDVALSFAKDPAQQDRLDRWTDERLTGERARVLAFFKVLRETEKTFRILYRILDVVVGLLVAVVTLMVALLISIHQAQRIQEFGLLQAIGYTRRAILGRVLAESALVIVGGWLLGVLIAFGILALVKAQLMDPRAFALDVFDTRALLYTVPIPLAILAAAGFTVRAKLRSFDPVSIVERRVA